MSFRVPYFIKYLEFLDEICNEITTHIELAKYAQKEKLKLYGFHHELL